MPLSFGRPLLSGSTISCGRARYCTRYLERVSYSCEIIDFRRINIGSENRSRNDGNSESKNGEMRTIEPDEGQIRGSDASCDGNERDLEKLSKTYGINESTDCHYDVFTENLRNKFRGWLQPEKGKHEGQKCKRPPHNSGVSARAKLVIAIIFLLSLSRSSTLFYSRFQYSPFASDPSRVFWKRPKVNHFPKGGERRTSGPIIGTFQSLSSSSWKVSYTSLSYQLFSSVSSPLSSPDLPQPLSPFTRHKSSRSPSTPSISIAFCAADTENMNQKEGGQQISEERENFSATCRGLTDSLLSYSLPHSPDALFALRMKWATDRRDLPPIYKAASTEAETERVLERSSGESSSEAAAESCRDELVARQKKSDDGLALQNANHNTIPARMGQFSRILRGGGNFKMWRDTEILEYEKQMPYIMEFQGDEEGEIDKDSTGTFTPLSELEIYDVLVKALKSTEIKGDQQSGGEKRADQENGRRETGGAIDMNEEYEERKAAIRRLGLFDRNKKLKEKLTSNGFTCEDNEEVEKHGLRCKLIALSLGGRMGCNKLLRDLTPDGNVPAGAPVFSRVSDACPDTCGLCIPCAEGCALWFLGNSMCDVPCNNYKCQYDDGDCWKRDCVVSDWAEWGNCSLSCGGPGVRSRTRKVVETAKHGGKACQSLSEVEEGCNKDVKCPSDCAVGDWTAWSVCPDKCGESTSSRSRKITRQPDVLGQACPALRQSRRCYTKSCTMDCKVGEWNEWSECSVECDGGHRMRKRVIEQVPVNGGAACLSLGEVEKCNEFSCGAQCRISEWENWSPCSSDCGGGVKSRQRDVFSPTGRQAGCPPSKQQAPCNDHDCTSDCEVSAWSEYGPCSNSCGKGQKKRTRQIVKEKSGVGQDCPEMEQYSPCYKAPCSIDCEVSDWSPWSECLVPARSCKQGLKKRTRQAKIVNSDGGSPCQVLEETLLCSTREGCSRTCVLGEWNSWSNCAEECQNFFVSIGERQAMSSRTRHFALPAPDCPPLSSPALEEVRSCAVIGSECKLDCVVGSWSAWSDCSQTCGGGVQSRSRDVDRPQSGNGLECPKVAESRVCGRSDCPLEGQSVDCALSEWSEWSDCDVTCGSGRRFSTRQTKKYPSGQGKECTNHMEISQICNAQECVSDCVVSEWSAWSECSVSCDGGQRLRSRRVMATATGDGLPCPPLQETGNCGDVDCPSDCVMSEWGQWSDCSSSCGAGSHVRKRKIIKQPSLNPAGLSCGPQDETATCIGRLGRCGVDCLVGEWSEWTECSTTCGGGYRSSARSVLIEPLGDGVPCPQHLQRFSECGTQPCVLPCEFSEWSEWSACSVSCNDRDDGHGGSRVRTRVILRKPQNGGKKCPRLTDIDESCNAHTKCPVDCKYSEWAEWSECSASCGEGRITRSREVIRQALHRGKPCNETTDVMSCISIVPCKVDCELSAWSQWSECSTTCGGGERKRSKILVKKPSGGGAPCSSMDEFELCNSNSCAGSDCVFSDWSDWQVCSLPCGSGLTSRRRTIEAEPHGNGKPCPELYQRKGCNLQRCPDAPCVDNPDVPKITGVGCEVLSATGCDKLLTQLAAENNREMPDTVPPEVRIKDVCPVSCEACFECAPGCQLRDVGQLHCDEACNNPACEMDKGDCGGDCKVPHLPPSVKNLSGAPALSKGQIAVLSCTGMMDRFEGWSSLREIALSCLDGGRYTQFPQNLKMKENPQGEGDRGSLQKIYIPPCIPDSCYWLKVSGFSDDSGRSFNGVYRRGNAAFGHTRYVLDTMLASNSKYLWAHPGGNPSAPNTFVWRITADDPVTGMSDSHPLSVRSAGAASTSPSCLTPSVGSDSSITCVDGKPWLVGFPDDSHTVEENGVSLRCLTDEEKRKIQEEEQNKGGMPKTIVGGVERLCEDQEDVEAMSGMGCEKLKNTVGCNFRLKSSGKPLPEYLDPEATSGMVCPKSCGLCEQCSPGCPIWFKGNNHCDQACNNTACDYDQGDCGVAPKKPLDPSTDCEDHPAAFDVMGNHCRLLNEVANENCSTPLATVAEHLDVPYSPLLDKQARLEQICPKTCKVCNIKTLGSPFDQTKCSDYCCDNPRVESETGYTCKQIKMFVQGDCLTKLKDISDKPLPADMPQDTTLEDACPFSCGMCISPDCTDNPAVEAQGNTCKALKSASDLKCEALLSDLVNEGQALPDGVPTGSRVRDACMRTCGACPKEKDLSSEDPCHDDSRVLQMSYSCPLFLEYGVDGCETILGDLIPRSRILPDGLSFTTRVREVCRLTCMECQKRGSSKSGCSDNPLVEEQNLSCNLLIAAGGCNAYLRDLSREPLPEEVPQQTRVKDVCRESCGLCITDPTCHDGFMNGEEEGVDCGGRKCRRCQDCAPQQIKSLGNGYSIVSGLGVQHNSTRLIRCSPTHERLAGREPEEIKCIDGEFDAPILKCGVKKLDLHISILTLSRARDFGAETIHSIHSSLVQALEIQKPDELKVLAMGSDVTLTDEDDGSDICENNPAMASSGYDCDALTPFCSYELAQLAVTQGARLPNGIPSGSLVQDACPFSCGVCVPSRLRSLGVEPLAKISAEQFVATGDDVKVLFAVLWKHPTIAVETHLSVDLHETFISQLAAQFVMRGIRLQSGIRGGHDIDAAHAVQFRPIVAQFTAPELRRLPLSLWADGFGTKSGQEKTKGVLTFRGLPLPSTQLAEYSSPMPYSKSALNPLLHPQLGPEAMVHYAPPTSFSSQNASSSTVRIALSPILGQIKGTCYDQGGQNDGTLSSENDCCGFETEFHEILGGDCGKLLYETRIKNGDVVAFCEGFSAAGITRSSEDYMPRNCKYQFHSLVKKYEDRRGAACQLLQFARDVIESWCAPDLSKGEGQMLRESQRSTPIVDSHLFSTTQYCFSSIEKNVKTHTLGSLASKPSYELDHLCKPTSCLRHHLRYLDAMTQLQIGWSLSRQEHIDADQRWGRRAHPRKLVDASKTVVGNAGTDKNDFHSSNNEFKYSDLGDSFAGRAIFGHIKMRASYVKGVEEGLRRSVARSDLFDLLPKVREKKTEGDRRSFSKVRSPPHGPSETPRRRLNSQLKDVEGPVGETSEDILDFVCTKVDDDYCQGTIQLLVEESPIKNTALVKEPCSSRCFVPITGKLGGMIESYSLKFNDPYNAALGSIMRGYGRYYCTRNESGSYCGDLLFSRIKKTIVPFHTPTPLEIRQPDCHCPVSYLQDGECDPECFTESCSWDGEDCLVQRMFPEVYVALSSLVERQCSFYEPTFTCSNKCRSQFDTSRTVSSQGCCLGSAFEMLGLILQRESQHPLIPSTTWKANRSIGYLEQVCSVSMDRTCAAGNARKIIKVTIGVHNVNRRALLRKLSKLKEVERHLQLAVSQYLRLSNWDVVRIVTRPTSWGIAIEIDIDGGQEISRLEKILERQTNIDSLRSLIQRRLGAVNLEDFRQSPEVFPAVSIDAGQVRMKEVVSPPMNFSVTPPLPYRGTLGLEDLLKAEEAHPTTLFLSESEVLDNLMPDDFNTRVESQIRSLQERQYPQSVHPEIRKLTLPSEPCSAKDLWQLGPGYIIDIDIEGGSRGDGSSFTHGTRRIVRCSSHYQAVLGDSPDILVCDNGRWVSHTFLECKKGCKAEPEEIDDPTLKHRFMVHTEGSYTSHGATRSLSCKEDYTPTEGVEPSTVTCHNGEWMGTGNLMCRAMCSEFGNFGEAYVVEGVGRQHGDFKKVRCSKNYYPQNRTFKVFCVDGKWTETDLLCVVAEAPNPDSTSVSTMKRILMQVFSGPGVFGVLIIGLIVLLTGLGILLAWRFYFRKEARKNMSARDETVAQLKQSAAAREGAINNATSSSLGSPTTYERSIGSNFSRKVASRDMSAARNLNDNGSGLGYELSFSNEVYDDGEERYEQVISHHQKLKHVRSGRLHEDLSEDGHTFYEGATGTSQWPVLQNLAGIHLHKELDRGRSRRPFRGSVPDGDTGSSCAKHGYGDGVNCGTVSSDSSAFSTSHRVRRERGLAERECEGSDSSEDFSQLERSGGEEGQDFDARGGRASDRSNPVRPICGSKTSDFNGQCARILSELDVKDSQECGEEEELISDTYCHSVDNQDSGVGRHEGWEDDKFFQRHKRGRTTAKRAKNEVGEGATMYKDLVASSEVSLPVHLAGEELLDDNGSSVKAVKPRISAEQEKITDSDGTIQARRINYTEAIHDRTLSEGCSRAATNSSDDETLDPSADCTHSKWPLHHCRYAAARRDEADRVLRSADARGSTIGAETSVEMMETISTEDAPVVKLRGYRNGASDFVRSRRDKAIGPRKSLNSGDRYFDRTERSFSLPSHSGNRNREKRHCVTLAFDDCSTSLRNISRRSMSFECEEEHSSPTESGFLFTTTTHDSCILGRDVASPALVSNHEPELRKTSNGRFGKCLQLGRCGEDSRVSTVSFEQPDFGSSIPHHATASPSSSGVLTPQCICITADMTPVGRETDLEDGIMYRRPMGQQRWETEGRFPLQDQTTERSKNSWVSGRRSIDPALGHSPSSIFCDRDFVGGGFNSSNGAPPCSQDTCVVEDSENKQSGLQDSYKKAVPWSS